MIVMEAIKLTNKQDEEFYVNLCKESTFNRRRLETTVYYENRT